MPSFLRTATGWRFAETTKRSKYGICIAARSTNVCRQSPSCLGGFSRTARNSLLWKKAPICMHVWDLASGARLETWRRAIYPDRDYQIGAISPDDRWCLTIGPDGAGVFRDIVRRLDVDPHLDARRP